MSRNKKEIKPNWRPDFRIASTLPDIKAIRTDFIINFVAVTLVLIVGAYVLQREYRALSLANAIEGLEQRIRVAEPEDRASLKLSGEFRDAARHIVEIESFYDSPILAHEFLARLSRLKPEDLIFNRVVASEAVSKEGIEYRITVTGEVRELPILNAFKTTLEDSELLAIEGFEVSIDETVQAPDEKTRIFPYRLAITLTPAKKSGGAEKGEDA